MNPVLENYAPEGEKRNTMITKKKPTQDSILNDVIHCASCGAGMVVKAANYVCPNAGQLPNLCPAVGVDARHLAHRLIATLVNRVLTPSAMSDMVERIQLDIAGNLQAQQGKLDNAEAAITELNNQKMDILSRVEYGETSYSEAAPQLDAIESSQAGLIYESAVSRTEIGKLDFAGDAGTIRSVAQDIGTYTEFAEPELAKELVNTFIAEVRVGVTSFEVAYTHPIPGEQGDALVTSETFPLPLPPA